MADCLQSAIFIYSSPPELAASAMLALQGYNCRARDLRFKFIILLYSKCHYIGKRDAPLTPARSVVRRLLDQATVAHSANRA
jgi:hypothetical protein